MGEEEEGRREGLFESRRVRAHAVQLDRLSDVTEANTGAWIPHSLRVT
jgi:hypothetical protein